MVRSIRKCLSGVIPIAWAISILASPGIGAPRHKHSANDERRLAIYGLIRQVVRQTDTFKSALKRSLKAGAYPQSGGRDDLKTLADNMRDQSRQIKADFKASKSTDTVVTDVSDLFVSAERVNTIAANVALGAQTGSRWVDLRDAINNLGLVYKLNPLSPNEMLGADEALAVSKARRPRQKKGPHSPPTSRLDMSAPGLG
jgi:hypothetical protein